MPELASLIDPSVTPGPTLPPGHPFTTGTSGVQSAVYWSASTDADNPTDAWFVVFGNGVVNDFGKANDFGHAWCVRGGMNADAY
jgi:hypothetical protein